MSEACNVAIHIERVVVDAPQARASDALQIQTAMEAELTRLFSDRGPLVEGRLERSVSAKSNALGRQSTPAGVGEEIARVIYGTVTGAG